MSPMASQAGVGQSYIFNRDHRSSIRLNYNHWMMKGLCDYLLNPTIPFNAANVRIADIGTGTASVDSPNKLNTNSPGLSSLWPLELANKLPRSARLDGFDISSDQYPHRDWRPENVNLLTHDTFKPFPSEYLGKYDVVHIRFFLCIVNNEDAEPLLKNLLTLLKPGGYLQWVEPDPLGSQMKTSNPVASTQAVERLAAMMHKPKANSTYDWVGGMPSSFEKNGLSVETYHKIPMKDVYRPIWNQSNLAGLEDLAADSNLVGIERAEETRKFMTALSTEFSQGVSLDTPWLCVVGRKRF